MVITPRFDVFRASVLVKLGLCDIVIVPLLLFLKPLFFIELASAPTIGECCCSEGDFFIVNRLGV